MNNHYSIQNELAVLLSKKGVVKTEYSLDLESSSKKYKIDLFFENVETKVKVIIEVKENYNNLSLSIGTLSYIAELKNLLDNHSYRMVVIFTNDLTPNFDKVLRGRVAYYSLKEKSLTEIAELIFAETSLSNTSTN